MSRKLGFNYRAAVRKLDPALHRRLYPDPTREIDIRNRLDRIDERIEDLSWGRNAQGTADKVAELVDEKHRLTDALNRQPARHATTEKSSESEGKPG